MCFFVRTLKLHLEVRGPLFWSCPRGDPEGSYRWLYWRWCLCLRSKSFEAADRSWQLHGFPPRLMRKWRKWLWALDWLDLIGRCSTFENQCQDQDEHFLRCWAVCLSVFCKCKECEHQFQMNAIWMPLDIIGTSIGHLWTSSVIGCHWMSGPRSWRWSVTRAGRRQPERHREVLGPQRCFRPMISQKMITEDQLFK